MLEFSALIGIISSVKVSFSGVSSVGHPLISSTVEDFAILTVNAPPSEEVVDAIPGSE